MLSSCATISTGWICFLVFLFNLWAKLSRKFLLHRLRLHCCDSIFCLFFCLFWFPFDFESRIRTPFIAERLVANLVNYLFVGLLCSADGFKVAMDYTRASFR